MKYAIISDVHANLEALNAVLAHARADGVKQFICLGDIVGYNADPEACVDIIRELGCPVVMGNHDSYTVADEIPEAVNGRARKSLEWTRENIRPDQHEWLASLPMQRRVGTLQIVHASLHQPEDWNYVHNAIEAVLHFHFQDAPLCFFGHTHNPMYFSTEERKTYKDYEQIVLEPGVRYMVNAGSVGQPRGDDKRAQYATYDTREKLVELHRVDYDVATTCKKIIAAELPIHNALRLEKNDLDAAIALKEIESEKELAESLM